MEPESKEVDHEKRSDVYKDIASLVMAKSVKFSENIKNKVQLWKILILLIYIIV